ncbi:MAG: polysaccharide deacetylase family protein [Candidatus Omnitrophota bacterium]|nr:polysaccharide deacetylase family protein [Candidatus Omnitrophota bacterium]
MNPALAIKSFLSKLNFLLGNKPKLLSFSKENLNKFIPPSYKAVLIISCDFELIWAWRFAKEINCDLKRAMEIAKRERENVPLILELCERFNIPVTWAIVGHLFLKNCSKTNDLAHKDMLRLNYFENEYWKFSSGDWFDADPCCNFRDALEWYAPDLIEKILNSTVKHEIACHSFSHIDCREEVCSEQILRKEIQECKNAASIYKVELKSFVFPANYIGNRKVLKEEGFISYRIDKNVLGFPQKDAYGLWRIPTTAHIGLPSYNWSLDYYLRRCKTIIERAIKYNRLCHFWFHPSIDRKFLENILSDLFDVVNINRNKLYVTTMGGYIAYLESIVRNTN